MATSDRDRAAMRRLARDLGQIERSDEASSEALAAAVAAADVERRLSGRTELIVDAVPPEEGFYARARALGFR